MRLALCAYGDVMAAGRPIGTAFVEIDLDASRYTRGQQQLYKDATTTSLSIEENFKKLGIKTAAEFDLMRAKIQNAYASITHSSQATANDILRAEQAKNAQLTALNEQQFGKQLSLIDRLKANWIAASAAIVAAWAAISKATQFTEMAAKALQAEESFRLVAESSKIAADSLLANLHRAAAGTVDDSDIMQAAVKGMVLGLTDKQLVTIMENARLAARYAGTDVKTAFEDITNAIGTDMPRALRQYGLITREESRLVQEALAAGAKDISLYNIAMAHAAVNTAKFGEAQTNAAENIQIFRATIKEAKETTGKWFNDTKEFLIAAGVGYGILNAKAAAALAQQRGDIAEYNRQTALATEYTRQRNAMLGIQTEEEKKAAEAKALGAKATLKDAEAALKGEQQKLKTAVENAAFIKKAEQEREQATKQAIEATRQAQVGAQGIGQGPFALDEARIKSMTEKYRQAGVDRVIIEKFVAAERAVVQAKMALEEEKAEDEAFKALRDRGQASLREELEWMRQRAALARLGPAERIKAEADAFKFAQGMVDRLFAHEQALGQKSLQDAIAFEQGRADAAKQGSEARMKAEEAVYQKQEELRNKARSAALGILGEVGERLGERGITDVTQSDVARELMELQRERGKQFRESAGRFRGGGAVDIIELIAGIQAGAKIEDLQKQLGQLGGLGGIFGGATEVAPGPLTSHLGLVRPDQTPGGGDWVVTMAQEHRKAFASMQSDVEALSTLLSTRLPAAGAKYIQNVVAVVEQAFIRKIMDESGRG